MDDRPVEIHESPVANQSESKKTQLQIAIIALSMEVFTLLLIPILALALNLPVDFLSISILLSFIIGGAVAGIIFFCLKKKKTGIVFFALSGATLLLMISTLTSGLFLILIILLLPIVGTVLGTFSLCMWKKGMGKPGLITSIIATALLPVTIVAFIILFSSGAMVISLM